MAVHGNHTRSKKVDGGAMIRYTCKITFTNNVGDVLYGVDHNDWVLHDGSPVSVTLTRTGDDPRALLILSRDFTNSIGIEPTSVRIYADLYASEENVNNIVNIDGLIAANKLQAGKISQNELTIMNLNKLASSLTPKMRDLLQRTVAELSQPVSDVKHRTLLIEEIKKVLL